MLFPRLDLYLVTDASLSNGRSTLDMVTDAIRGGVTCVQLREKNATAKDFLHTAQQLRPLLEKHRIPFIINDRIDIALAANADGIHIGQSDIPLPDAKKIFPDKIIGITIHSAEQAVLAEKEGATYVAVSPVFDTPTKTDTPPGLGLEGVSRIRKSVSIPVVAIGGIQLNNAAEILQAGADGLAVVSALVSAPDISFAAKQFTDLIQQVKYDSHS